MDMNNQKLEAAKLRWEASLLAKEARFEILSGLEYEHHVKHYGGEHIEPRDFRHMKTLRAEMENTEKGRMADAPFITRVASEIHTNEDKYMNLKEVVGGVYPDVESADSARKRKRSADRDRELEKTKKKRRR
ncbi:hypothetical protein OROMI_026523 [Orobanche minor]